MDPKSPNQLDPKLKEAYERVMGTGGVTQAPVSQTATPPSGPTQPVPSSVNQAKPNITGPEPITPPRPVAPPTTPAPNMITPPSANPILPGSPMGAGIVKPSPPMKTASIEKVSTGFVMGAGKSKLRVSSPLLIVSGVVFFIVYTIFWIRFFNINVPLPF